MWTVRLTRIPENGSFKEESLNLGLDALGLKEPFEPGSLSLSWELSRRLGQVYGAIRAQARLTLSCSRCLEDFSAPVRAECQVLFEERPRSKTGRGGEAQSEGAGAEAGWEDAEDAGSNRSYYDGEELPVGEEARQELELAVPFNPLCRADCKGLCPRCGTNLNQSPCGCPKLES